MANGGVRWAFNDDDDAESMRGVAELRGHTSVLAIRRDARRVERAVSARCVEREE